MPAIEQKLITSINRPKRNLAKLKGVVVHYTANYSRGADALAHFNYFNRSIRVNGRIRIASAHYMVDDQRILQLIPDAEVAFHCGAVSGLPYTDLANNVIRENGLSANEFLIGIEMCVNVDGVWEKTYAHTVELTGGLLRKHGLGLDQLYRHYDITHKVCPKMFVEAPSLWTRFKNDVQFVVKGNLVEQIRRAVVVPKELNVRSSPRFDPQNPDFNLIRRIPTNEVVHIYGNTNGWADIGNGEWVKTSLLRILLD